MVYAKPQRCLGRRGSEVQILSPRQIFNKSRLGYFKDHVKGLHYVGYILGYEEFKKLRIEEIHGFGFVEGTNLSISGGSYFSSGTVIFCAL